MNWEDERRKEHDWRKGIPSDNGLYDYIGTLYPVGSDEPVKCEPFCRLNVRQGDGARVSISGLDGQEFDLIRTGDGQWRGPVGPVHIPSEDIREPRPPQTD